jgi:hypothetical protein
MTIITEDSARIGSDKGNNGSLADSVLADTAAATMDVQ